MAVCFSHQQILDLRTGRAHQPHIQQCGAVLATPAAARQVDEAMKRVFPPVAGTGVAAPAQQPALYEGRSGGAHTDCRAKRSSLFAAAGRVPLQGQAQTHSERAAGSRCRRAALSATATSLLGGPVLWHPLHRGRLRVRAESRRRQEEYEAHRPTLGVDVHTASG